MPKETQKGFLSENSGSSSKRLVMVGSWLALIIICFIGVYRNQPIQESILYCLAGLAGGTSLAVASEKFARDKGEPDA